MNWLPRSEKCSSEDSPNVSTTISVCFELSGWSTPLSVLIKSTEQVATEDGEGTTESAFKLRYAVKTWHLFCRSCISALYEKPIVIKGNQKPLDKSRSLVV